MNIEIERKYLVCGDFKPYVVGKFDIKQGYISTDPNRVVRIRTTNKKGFITIKGSRDESGIARLEWEREILFGEAIALLELCNKPLIEKVRFIIEHHDHIIEVDEFLGENEGLVLAEIELSEKVEVPDLPKWLGEEVTQDFKYYNSYLATHPFSTWGDSGKPTT